MPQFCILLYANYTILAIQRGGAMAQCPPLKYAPVFPYFSVAILRVLLQKNKFWKGDLHCVKAAYLQF